MPYEAVDTTFRDALRSLKGKLLVGVINSIGARRDARAVGVLKGLMYKEDAAVAAASGIILESALGAVPEARRAAVADACFACAEILLRQGKPNDAVRLYDAVRQAKVPAHLRVAVETSVKQRVFAGYPLRDSVP